MESKAIDFSDLEDPSYFEGDQPESSAVADALAAGGLQEAGRVYVEQTGRTSSAQREQVKCRDCGGSGVFKSWRGREIGKCFKCDGKGYQLRAAGYTARRLKAVEKSTAAKAAELAAREEWALAHVDVIAAVIAGKGEFMESLARQYAAKGRLSDGQVAAVRRGIEKRKEWAEQKAAGVITGGVEAAGAGLDKLTASFEAALRSGLKSPAMQVSGLVFKPAKASSTNAGAIYVTAGREYGATYFGKVMGGRFLKSRECDPETESKVAAVLRDPLAAAVAYGKETGRCSCCGRVLENEESVRLGIGPVCREKWAL